MTAKYAALLRAVTLTSSSVLRVTENGTATNITARDPATGSALASSKRFYLRGDGSDDDLLQVLIETIQAHGGSNTYTGSLALSVDPAATSAVVTITLTTGTNNFQINWSHASTTFDPAWFGFADANTANDTADKVSTLSPSALWVAADVYESYERTREHAVSVSRARSGAIKTEQRGGPFHLHRLVSRYLDSRRMLEDDNASDPDAAFSRFLASTNDGTAFEVHALALDTGSALEAMTVYTRLQETHQWTRETAAAFRPARLSPGLALYDLDVRMHSFGDTTAEPTVPDLITGAALNLDASDSSSFSFSSGAVVSEWRDVSGNARHANDAVSSWSVHPSLVAGVQNGLGGVRFGNSTESALESDNADPASEVLGGVADFFTVYVVAKPEAIHGTSAVNFNADDLIFGHNNQGTYITVRKDGVGGFYVGMNNYDGAEKKVEAALVSETDAFVACFRYDGANIYASVNDGAESSTACGDKGVALTFPYILGRFPNNGNYFEGYVLQIITYVGDAHDATERTQNFDALAAKWGTP